MHGRNLLHRGARVKRMRVVISGATGVIGRRLVKELDAEVTVLSRDPNRARRELAAARFVAWDGQSPLDPSVMDGVDVVYHLAGEPVAAGRWTAEKKRRIVESRELGTRAVVDAIIAAKSGATLVNASAVGYYGDRGDELLTEESAAGQGFLADVCRRWEREAARLESSGNRTTRLRIGIVLALEGGALAEMLPIFRTGLAGRIGSGKQWMPWIHIDDVVALLRRAGETPDLSGPVNATAPQPVTNAAFTKALARQLHRPALFAAPRFALRLAVGELATSVVASQRVVPERALRVGFAFRHPELGAALADLLGDRRLEAATA